ncbi:MAG: 3'-5' exonuclease [Candidatus Moraniibacteriota bacterium]
MRSIIPDLLPLERPLVVFDLETTGLSTTGDDRIIEIAYQKIMPDGEVISRSQRLNPGRVIPEDSIAVHGITDADVAAMPSFAQQCYEWWNLFDGADVGGFNVTGYDLPFLRSEFALVGKTFDYSKCRILDAKILYHQVTPRVPGGARNLSAAYKTYCGEQHTLAHAAAGDVEATVKILEKILEKHPEFRNWETIAELHGNKKLLDSVKNEHGPLVTAATAAAQKASNTLF